jgi:hypothetical protein
MTYHTFDITFEGGRTVGPYVNNVDFLSYNTITWTMSLRCIPLREGS